MATGDAFMTTTSSGYSARRAGTTAASAAVAVSERANHHPTDVERHSTPAYM